MARPEAPGVKDQQQEASKKAEAAKTEGTGNAQGGTADPNSGEQTTGQATEQPQGEQNPKS